MLVICYDSLDEIDRLPVEKTLGMLEMVSTAQNFWSLAMDDVGKHPKLLPALTKHVEHLTIEFLPSDSKEIITEKACKIAVAAYISKILALFMHSRPPSERDQEFFAKLLPQLNFYFEKAVKIGGYRPSLHLHLQKNFEEKWPGIKLIQLKKTRLRRTIYGPNAVYDVELGDKILGFDPGWAGRPDGYRNEVEQANLNLSLVQTQVVSCYPCCHCFHSVANISNRICWRHGNSLRWNSVSMSRAAKNSPNLWSKWSKHVFWKTSRRVYRRPYTTRFSLGVRNSPL
jgi:nuclear pore complex protein Nup188